MITRASQGWRRCIPMRCKGVVVVPAESPSCRPHDDAAATRRIANRAIVCHVLDGLVAAGLDELAVVSPPELAYQIRRCIEEDGGFGSVTHLTYSGRGDLLGALAAAETFVGDDACLVHTADGLVGLELIQLAELLESDPSDLVLLLHRTAEKRERLGAAAQRLLGISELNGSKTCLSLVSVCLFGPSALRLACARAGNAEDDLDFTGIAEHLADAGRSLRTKFVRTWRRYCGDPLDLLELNRIVLDQQTPELDTVDGGDNRIEGRVIIHPTAEVSSSIILGPTIIGPSARISNSYIGPYTSIGAGAEIEGAEIERSIISDGARIMHVGGRIEASTVGRSARIFRDFALPRAMRLHVGDGVELALN
jgi:glucose-1-phosphate thymidylyltransferase